jgi:hypothetical protein
MKFFLPGITYFYLGATLGCFAAAEQNAPVQARATSSHLASDRSAAQPKPKHSGGKIRRGRCRAACLKAPRGRDTRSPGFRCTARLSALPRWFRAAHGQRRTRRSQAHPTIGIKAANVNNLATPASVEMMLPPEAHSESRRAESPSTDCDLPNPAWSHSRSQRN